MKKEELKELLKELLGIRLESKRDYDGKCVRVTILFDGEEICHDSYYL